MNKHPCEFYIDGYTKLKEKYDALVKSLFETISWHEDNNTPINPDTLRWMIWDITDP